MQLHFRTDTVPRWRLLLHFHIEQLEATKTAADQLARISLDAGGPWELRIVDAADVAVLHYITPLGWRTPRHLEEYQWVP